MKKVLHILQNTGNVKNPENQFLELQIHADAVFKWPLLAKPHDKTCVLQIQICINYMDYKYFTYCYQKLIQRYNNCWCPQNGKTYVKLSLMWCSLNFPIPCKEKQTIYFEGLIKIKTFTFLRSYNVLGIQGKTRNDKEFWLGNLLENGHLEGREDDRITIRYSLRKYNGKWMQLAHDGVQLFS